MASGGSPSESPAQKLDTHTQGCGGNTPLHEVVKRLPYSNPEQAKQLDEKHIQCIKLLLKFKPDVNAKNSEDYTPLHLAVLNERSVNVLKAFTDNGAELNATDGEGRTALYHAVFPTTSSYDYNFKFRFRDVGIVKHLVEKGAKINTVAMNGYSPFLLAVVLKNNDYVKTMLEKVSNLSESGLEQTTSKSCIQQSYSIGRCNTSVSYPSSEYYNMTPLLISVYDCNQEMAQMLIKAGASVNAVNARGENALHLLTQEEVRFFESTKRVKLCENQLQEPQEQIAKLLIDNGIDVNAKDNSGGTALNYAIKNDKHDIVVYMLENST